MLQLFARRAAESNAFSIRNALWNRAEEDLLVKKIGKRIEQKIDSSRFTMLRTRRKHEAKISACMAMFHELFEGALVNYVVSGALPPTTHSGDASLMRFRAFT